MNGADDNPGSMQDLVHEQIERVQHSLGASCQHALNTLAMHIQFKATTLDMKVCQLLKENEFLRAQLSGAEGLSNHDGLSTPSDEELRKHGDCTTQVAASVQVQPPTPPMTEAEPTPQLPTPAVQRPLPVPAVPSAPPQPNGLPVDLKPWRNGAPAAAPIVHRNATGPRRHCTLVGFSPLTSVPPDGSKMDLQEQLRASASGDDSEDINSDAEYRSPDASLVARSRATLFDDSEEPTEGSDTGEKDRPRPKKTTHRPLFADATAMKEKVRANLMKPAYKVSDYYWSAGLAQRIARSPLFDNLTLGVIAFNALWISVDTDYNKAPTLLEAHFIFQLAENFFGVYFTFEWIVRMAAFKRKRDATRDSWFIFDTLLLVVMICEIWLITLYTMVTAKSGGNNFLDADMSILKIMRLVRTTRMARVAKLLKAVPELMVLLKGMFVATRSVFFTLCLLLVFIYVFAVGLTQLTAGTPVAERYFRDVPAAMASLLLYGTLPDLADMVIFVGGEKFYFAVVLCVFILLATLTVMNMLVGVLVEVVGVVSSVEKEAASITHVKAEMMTLIRKTEFRLRGGSKPGSSEPVITKDDFITLLGRPEAARILQGVGVDAVGLVDFGDFIFRDDAKTLSFSDFMELVLQLRGTNTATVKDIVDMRKFMMVELENMHRQVTASVDANVQAYFYSLRRKLFPGEELPRSRKSTLERAATMPSPGACLPLLGASSTFNSLPELPRSIVAPDAGPAVSAACCSQLQPARPARVYSPAKESL